MHLDRHVLCLLTLVVFSAQAKDATQAPQRSLRAEEEAPKGLSIVPWKRSEPGALPEGPLRLLDYPLAPLDPEVFQRELDLIKEVQP